MEATPLWNWSLLVLFLVLAAQSILLAVAILMMNATDPAHPLEE